MISDERSESTNVSETLSTGMGGGFLALANASIKTQLDELATTSAQTSGVSGDPEPLVSPNPYARGTVGKRRSILTASHRVRAVRYTLLLGGPHQNTMVQIKARRRPKPPRARWTGHRPNDRP